MITFLYPALLAALLALPVLWYFLRVTPPPPKRVFFPPTRFLMGLIPQEQTPSKTPWWILLLRLLMAALVIIALARPVLNPSGDLTGSGPVRMIIDNSWASAQVWDLQIIAAEEAIAQAGREKREIYILTTAPTSADQKPLYEGPLAESDAKSVLRGLKPLPWRGDYEALQKRLTEKNKTQAPVTLWFSHGLNEGNIAPLVNDIQNQGGLEFVLPTPEKLPLLLRPTKAITQTINTKDQQPQIRIDVDAPKTIPRGLNVGVQAQGQNSQILDIQSAALEPARLPQTISFDIAPPLQANLSQFKISANKGAGAIYLLDDQSKKRDVGIVGSAEQSEATPLMDDAYYIKRALEPYANIARGSIMDLINQKLPMIVLPDVAAMPTETLNALESWVKDGGLLLRFSGPNMAQNQSEQFLLPVPLRSGGRSLSGAMTWEQPQKIAPFPENSPLFGLDIAPDLMIRQQILADPSEDITGKVWAQLEDGTPLITATNLDKGLIVLVHTSAGPDWSDLPLSGLYVNALKRISALSGKGFSPQTNAAHTTLEPILIMDGFGALMPPDPTVLPLPVKDVEKTIPSVSHPPGLYGHSGAQFALNLGAALPALKSAEANLPSSVTKRYYESDYEIDLMPQFLALALALFLIDWLVMMVIAGRFSAFRFRKIGTAVFIFLVILQPSPSSAATADDIQYAGGLYLAYIKTGDTQVDSLSQTGLEKLAKVLKQRTSVEPDGVVGLDPEKDSLAFFPIIYWPVVPTQVNPSEAALRNVQFYLDHGGTILFDTRDQNKSTDGLTLTDGTRALRAVSGSLNLPPLSPIAADHVLGRSFYLLETFPGRFEQGTLWIAQDGMNGRDGVSPVIIGSNDWASAWAAFSERGSRYDPTQRSNQPEMAMRFGVNLVMYALTGNYKADQVHIPFILERLGK